MGFHKNIWSQMHRFVLWALLSTVFWAWIFTLVTDTVPEKKVTVYVLTEECRSTELALELEDAKPAGIKMIKVHPFSYAAFGNADLLGADLYIVGEKDAEEMLPSFAPLDGEQWDPGERETLSWDGAVRGVKIYDGAAGAGAAAGFIGYEPGQDYYLFFNADSLHLGSGDGAALRVAEALLKLK